MAASIIQFMKHMYNKTSLKHNTKRHEHFFSFQTHLCLTWTIYF